MPVCALSQRQIYLSGLIVKVAKVSILVLHIWNLECRCCARELRSDRYCTRHVTMWHLMPWNCNLHVARWRTSRTSKPKECDRKPTPDQCGPSKIANHFNRFALLLRLSGNRGHFATGGSLDGLYHSSTLEGARWRGIGAPRCVCRGNCSMISFVSTRCIEVVPKSFQLHFNALCCILYSSRLCGNLREGLSKKRQWSKIIDLRTF